MIKGKFKEIRESVLSKYVSVYCEATDSNEVVMSLRDILNLDDSWESSYKIQDFNQNVLVKFTNGEEAIEIEFISTVGNAVCYSIKMGNKFKVVKNETDDIKNILNILTLDKSFKNDINELNEFLSSDTK